MCKSSQNANIFLFITTTVICPAGHYGIIVGDIGKCVVCPVNTYQPMEGQFDCLPCPNGHVTFTNGVVEAKECILGKSIPRGHNPPIAKL